MGVGLMIEAIAVKLPAFVFTFDGTQACAQEIADMLKAHLDDGAFFSAHFTTSTEFGPRLHITLEDLTEMGANLYMSPGDSATIVVDPEDGLPLWVENRMMQQETIVVEESRRALGGAQ